MKQRQNTVMAETVRDAPSRCNALLLALWLTVGCAPAAPARDVPVMDEVRALVKAGSPGAVVYVADGEESWSAAAGLAKPGEEMGIDHRFRIASITKTYTAALVARQVLAGGLRLTDRVDLLLPGVTRSKATLAHLLKHTSGIGDYLRAEEFARLMSSDGNHRKEWTPRQLVKFAGEPGRPADRVSYSNTNYILLGMILEKYTRKPYRELIRQIGGTDTELPSVLLPGRLAHGTHLDGTPGSTDASASLFFSAGGLVSTVSDVATFYRKLFSGRMPEGALVRQGYGVFKEKLACGAEVFSHSGMLLGYGGVAISSADGTKVVVVQVNSSHAGAAIAAGQRLMCAL